MAETQTPLTTEDYTHEEAIARIDLLEEAIEEALEALAAHQLVQATEILAEALEPEEEEDEDEEEDLEEEELEAEEA
jgi:Mor family transcriptional regulator